MKLFSLDIQTILALLSLGNVISLFVYLSYQPAFNKKSPFLWFLLAKLFQASAWLLLALRGYISDAVSVYIGNSLLYSGFGLEAVALVSVHQIRRKVAYLYICLVLAGTVCFVLFSPNPGWRVVNSSAVVFVLHLTTAILLLRARPETRLSKALGLFFLLFALVMAVRAFSALSAVNTYSLLTGSLIQYVSFVVPFAFMLIGGIGFIFMLKEDGDRQLQDSQEKFSKAFNAAPYAVVMTRLDDGTIFEINKGFEKITGYTAQDAIGRTSLELNLWVDADDRNKMRDMVSSQGSVSELEFRFRCKNGQSRFGLYSAELMQIGSEKVLVSTVNDITQRKHNETLLQQMLEEKTVLLHEVHHRIKNNMTMVQSLLSLQLSENVHPDAESAIRMAITRVHGIASLYDRLYRTEGNYTLPFGSYLPGLVREILSLFPGCEDIRIDSDIEEFELDLKTSSFLSIIYNELITNSVKYAFKPGQEAIIRISARVLDRFLVFGYSDNGPGLADPDIIRGKGGLGWTLIPMLVTQMHGTVYPDGQCQSGLLISIPRPALTGSELA